MRIGLIELGALGVSSGLLVWTWGLYTAWMAWRARHAQALPTLPAHAVSFSVVIATRDDPAVLAVRVDNLRALPDRNRPADIILAVDSRAEWSLADYEAALGADVRVVQGDAPGGKSAGLNAGVRASSRDIVVLADSKQQFVAGSLDALLAAFLEPNVAGVSGTVRQSSGDSALDAYWRTDTLVRRGQSAAHSVVTSTGQIAAFLRTSYPTLPDDLICDDLYATAAVIMQGHRVTFTEHAIALDDRTFTRTQNLQRKIRTLSGLVQVCQLLPTVLNPARNPIWIHFVSQKLLRLVTPVLVMIAGWALLSLTLSVALPVGAARLIALVAFIPLLSVRLSIDRAAAWLGPAAFLWVLLVALYNGLRRHYDVWHAHPTVQLAADSAVAEKH